MNMLVELHQTLKTATYWPENDPLANKIFQVRKHTVNKRHNDVWPLPSKARIVRTSMPPSQAFDEFSLVPLYPWSWDLIQKLLSLAHGDARTAPNHLA